MVMPRWIESTDFVSVILTEMSRSYVTLCHYPPWSLCCGGKTSQPGQVWILDRNHCLGCLEVSELMTLSQPTWQESAMVIGDWVQVVTEYGIFHTSMSGRQAPRRVEWKTFSMTGEKTL
nr:TPA_asm: hypothetical protein [Tilapia lake virus]DBA09006.1 TPA_asm: hypothetical protein [Tilapia lake virus]